MPTDVHTCRVLEPSVQANASI